MPKCPSCGREIKVLWGTFTCPWCREKIRWYLGRSLLECSLAGTVLLFLFLYVLASWALPVEQPLLSWVLGLLGLITTVLFYFVLLWKKRLSDLGRPLAGTGLLFILFLLAFWVLQPEYPLLSAVVLLLGCITGLFFYGVLLLRKLRGIAPHA
jgi:membrane associated rhomboid family serine protease